MAGLLKLNHVRIPVQELLTSEDGTYTYIQTELSRRNTTPYLFLCVDRAGWSFSFLSTANLEYWRLIVKSLSGGLGTGQFSGILFYATT